MIVFLFNEWLIESSLDYWNVKGDDDVYTKNLMIISVVFMNSLVWVVIIANKGNSSSWPEAFIEINLFSSIL